MLIDLPLRPGLVTDTSDYAARGFWTDAENVRWINGALAKRGGFVNGDINCPNDGVPRQIIIWQDNRGEDFMAIATHQKLLLVYDGICRDITPAGLTLSDDSGYDAGTGYGAGSYGESTYGTPRSTADFKFKPTNWSLTTWGEDLIANVYGGKIYYWRRSGGISGQTASAAVPIDGLSGEKRAPNVANLVLTSMPDRHLIAFGVDPIDSNDNTVDPMLIRWGHQQSLVDWNPTNINTSGDHLLEKGTEIVGVVSTGNQILVSTDVAVYIMEFVNYPLVYSVRELATGCASISQDAMVDVNGVAYWMGNGGFYRYSGGVPQELPCPIKYTIFEDIDPARQRLIFAAHNTLFDEVSWFYEDADGVGKYVTYNYVDNWWSRGTSDAVCWADRTGIYDTPVSFDSTGQMRLEEVGYNNGDSPLPCQAECAPISLTQGAQGGAGDSQFISDGDALMYLSRIITDYADLDGQLELTVVGKKYPNAVDLPAKTKTLFAGQRKVDVKYLARQIRLKFASNELNNRFQLGVIRADIAPGSRR